MNTDELIRTLSRQVAPVSRHALEKRLVAGLAGGSIIALIGVSAWLGVRADFGAAAGTFPFIVKAGYTASLAAGAIAACVHLMRPEAKPTLWYWALAAPAILLAAAAGLELANAPRAMWTSLIFGQSASTCLLRITTISVPIFAGLAWAYRGFAPTRLRAAGAAIGLAAGAIAAALYALHCLELSACFVFVWYSLAMIGTVLAGMLLGPTLLRW